MGEVAHIVAESPDGPRGESPLGRSERNRYENLLLLCHLHHELIDSQPATYTVEWLLDIRARHEQWVELRLGSDDIALDRELRRHTSSIDPAKLEVVATYRDPALLGIHPAIPLPAALPGLDSRMPTYVERDVDTDLRRETEAALERGGFVVLVGGTVSGKSRSAFEAISAVMPDWRLFVPVDAKEINGLASADIGAGKIVVWIDELKPILEDPDLTVRAFRDLVGNAATPVMIIGCIWPEDFDALTHQPKSAQPDRYLRARQILKLGRRFDIPARFSRTELKRARTLVETDPRLHEALFHASADESPIAVLACAPELISMLTTAPMTPSRLLVEAAVEARLSGHSKSLPTELLRSLSALKLTPADRARASSDWFETALKWASAPVRGIVPMLKPYAQTVGQVDGYEVSDILASYVYEQGQFRPIDVDPGVWELLSSTSDIDSCLHIGINALQLGHTCAGRSALRRSADTGVDVAASLLGSSYLDDHNLDEALRWFTTAYEQGAPEAAGMIAVINSSLDQPALARRWLLVAAEADDPSAMFGLGQLEEDSGNHEEAYQWYSKAAHLRFPAAVTGLGGLHAARGEHDVAIGFWKQAAAAGESAAMMNLAQSDWFAGKTLGAERWWRAAAELGSVEAMTLLAEALWRSRRDGDEAAQWARTAAESGYLPAFGMLGRLLTELEIAPDEGLQWLLRGAEADQDNAIAWLGEALDDLGDIAGAEFWMAKLARKPNAPAAAQARYGVFLCQLGRTEEALTWIRSSFESGDHDSLRLLAVAAQGYPAIAAVIQPAVEPSRGPKLVPAPEKVQWTPIEQRCGCVIDWGWDQWSDPRAFMRWCYEMTFEACLWHGAGDGSFPEPDPEAMISLRDGDSGVGYIARKATEGGIEIGRELTKQLTDLVASSRDQLVETIPPTMQEFLVREGYDPADAWFESRLTDIVLNRGGGILDWQGSAAATEARRDAKPADGQTNSEPHS